MLSLSTILYLFRQYYKNRNNTPTVLASCAATLWIQLELAISRVDLYFQESKMKRKYACMMQWQQTPGKINSRNSKDRFT